MLVHHSSPFSLTCATPTCSSYYSARSHQPHHSSPLASPTYSSPTHDAQQRRRAQYKSRVPSLTSTPTSAKLLFRTGNPTPEDPQKSFLRERFQARCREHAQKLRKRTIHARRSSDVFMDCDDDDDESESDDVVMQDELFRRIIQNVNHKKRHAYRVSYALEVGSSFDPDMEDPSTWENELHDPTSSGHEPLPEDHEEAFFDYAEKCAALADFADLDLETDMDAEDWLADPPHNVGLVGDMDVS